MTKTNNSRCVIYEKMLRGESYDDILENVRIRNRKEMSIAHRSRITGLSKTACEELNRVYAAT